MIWSARKEERMPDISKLDRNFEVKTNMEKCEVKFYDVDEKPFKIYGIFKENGKYRRMPEKVAKTVSQGVYLLHTNTAGGRVRFVTDSSCVAVRAEMDGLGKMPHFALTGSVGFDLYADGDFVKTFVPPCDCTHGYESVVELGTNKLREITVNFPLYSNVKELYIGLTESAVVKEARGYKNTKPIVYYGSSITQGGCASRASMSYQAIISRRFNYDFINLGFSGNAMAEDEMIEYIKSLDMSLFVYDYDHNAPSVEHLANTHEKMFSEIRKAHPELPVIMMSRPKFYLTDEEEKRLKIIETTYNNAIARGDKNVFFIDGRRLTELCKNEGTVDGCHPTDFGFASMVKVLGDVIENINVN